MFVSGYVVHTDGGLDELVDEMNAGKCLYAFMRVTDPNTQLPKNVLVNWVHRASSVMCGMTMFGSVLSVCWFSCPLTTQQGLGESKCKHEPFTCVSVSHSKEKVSLAHGRGCVLVTLTTLQTSLE